MPKRSVKKQVSTVSNDELLDLIMTKKAKKTTKSSSKVKLSDKANVDSKIVKGIITDKNKVNKASLINKKKQTKNEIEIPKLKPKKGSLIEKEVNKEVLINEIIESQDNLEMTQFDLKFDLPNSMKRKVKPKGKNKVKIELPEEEEEAKARVNRHNVYKWLLIVGIIVSLVLIYLIISSVVNYKKKTELETVSKELISTEDKKIHDYYYECIEKPVTDSDISRLRIKEDELKVFFSRLNASIYYYDLTTGYEFKINEDETYYAASTIKVLSALYLYSKARSGSVDLNDTVKYLSKYDEEQDKSAYFNYKHGDNIKVRDLVELSLVHSDNLAYYMLVQYIGRTSLVNYALSLGAKNPLNVDLFGEVTVNDMFAYLKELSNFFSINDVYSRELNNFMVISDQNDLKLPGIDAATKYGEFGMFYHNIGIIYDEHPYILVVLTKDGKNEEEIQNISYKVKELHNRFYNLRKTNCEKTVNN